MKKTLSTLLLILLISAFSYGQETPSSKRNFSYIEVGGAGLFFSVNYERQLSKAPGISWRFGAGGYSEVDFYMTYNTGIAYLFSLNEKNNSFLELAGNVTLAREYIGLSGERRHPEAFLSVVPGLSYRKHFQNDIIFKAGLNAVMNGFTNVPWLNIGFGKRF